MRRRALFLGLAALSLCLNAQSSKPCRISIPVGVSEEKTNQPITGLTRSSFEVKSAKARFVPDRVDSVLADRIFIFVDASGSMTTPNSNNWALLRETTRELLLEIPRSVPVVVDVFADKNQRFDQRDAAFSFLKTYRDEAASKRPLGGRTRLYDTLRKAAISDDMKFGDMAILITDGGDNLSKSSTSELVRAFNARGTRITVLLIPIPDAGTVEEALGAENMQNISQATGGIVQPVPRKLEKNQTRLVPSEFHSSVLNYYRLQFESARFVGNKFQLNVLGNDGKKLKNAQVRVAHSAPLCSGD